MKIRILVYLLLFFNSIGQTQELAGFQIIDYLRNVTHPNCESAHSYITGPPNDSMWVNISNVETISGNFGSSWIDGAGPELILHSAFNKDKYQVRLLLNNGEFSKVHDVKSDDWVTIDGTAPWTYVFDQVNDCQVITGAANQVIVTLDFRDHFELQADDIVIGIEITLLITSAATDISGVYLSSNAIPCNPIDLGIDQTVCATDSIILNPGPFEHLLWNDGSNDNTYTVNGPDLGLGIHEVTVQALDINGCVSYDTVAINVERCFAFNSTGFCKNIILYPNPTVDILNVEFAQFELQEKIRIFTYHGQLIETIPITSNILNIDLSDYAQGLYLVKTNSGVCKFIRQ